MARTSVLFAALLLGVVSPSNPQQLAGANINCRSHQDPAGYHLPTPRTPPSPALHTLRWSAPCGSHIHGGGEARRVPVTPRAHEHCSSGSDFCFAMTMLWPRASFSLTFVDDGRATDRSCLFLPSAVVVSNSPEAACITQPTPYILNSIPSQGHAKAHGCQATALRRSHGGGPVLVQSFTPSHPKSGAKKILNPTTDFAEHSRGKPAKHHTSENLNS